MKNKIHNIFLENTLIGKTELEFGDPTMGVVFGKIDFININSVYDMFKEYCEKNEIEFEFDSEDKFITTRYIPKLKIIDDENTEIVGFGNYVCGIESDSFDIYVEGIPYPFYEEKFPNHIEDYKNKFS